MSRYSQIIFEEIRDADTPNFERARILCSKEKSIRGRLKEYTMGFPIDIETEKELPQILSNDDQEILAASSVSKISGKISRYWVDGKWITLKEVLAHPKMEVSKQAFFQKLSKNYTVEEAMKKGRRKC